MPVLYTIYCIRNVASGMLYVGQTSKTAEERLRAHRRKSLYHQTYKTSLYHDMHLYGQQAFDIRVIDTIESQEFADIYEAYYIAYFDTKVQKKCQFPIIAPQLFSAILWWFWNFFRIFAP